MGRVRVLVDGSRGRIRLEEPPAVELLGYKQIEELSANRLVPFYLMASITYYQFNDSFMEDGAYDRLCQRLDSEWSRITHPHKNFVDRESLAATTGYALRFNKLPRVVYAAALQLIKASREGRLLSTITPPTPVKKRTRISFD